MICTSCGHTNPERTKFYLECGTPFAARTECQILVPRVHEAAAVLAEALGDRKKQRAELREALRLYQTLGAVGHAERLAREIGA